jgi:hypothetical protein
MATFEEEAAAYSELLSEWYDEAWDRIVEFQGTFDQNIPEQRMRYLFTVHLMVQLIERSVGIPASAFNRLVPEIIARWQIAGKPDNFLVIKVGPKEGPADA